MLVLVPTITFAWHWGCVAAKVGVATDSLIIESINPLTNRVVVRAPTDGLSMLGHTVFAPMIEKSLRDKGREELDLWGILCGYCVVFDSGAP